VKRISTYAFACRFVAPQFPRVAEILRYPMVKPILDRIDANPGAIFVLLGATQLFKTLLGQLHQLRSQVIEPVPALWYERNQDGADETAEEKFNPLFDACMPAVVHKGATAPAPAILFADRTRRSSTHYTLPTGAIHRFLSAGVKLNRQGKSAQDLYLNESWTFDPGWIKDTQSRREDFPRFREIHMMTGPTHGSFAHELWEQSTKEVWHMRCTSCRKLIAPEIGDGKAPGGLRFESGPSVRDAQGKRILAATRPTVRLECPHCQAQFPNTDHARAALNAGGLLVPTNDTPERHIHGFRVPALPLRDWANIAVEMITAARAMRRGDLTLMEELVRKRAADVWQEDKHMQEKKARPLYGYRMRDEWEIEAKDPAGRPIRAMTVDVQRDHFVVVVRMYSKLGGSRLRWCEKVTTPSRVRDLAMEHGVIPERVYLDARHEPDYVRRIAALHGWRVLLGEDDRDYFHKATGLRRIYSEPRFIDAYAGTGMASGIVAQFNFSKQSALTRLHLLRTLPSATEGASWTAADDAPEWYWKEVDAHYRKKVTAADGSEFFVWLGLREDHAGDCEAMQIVFASMAGLVGRESIETEAEAPAPAAQQGAA
jgi:hypothetical protein